MITQSNKDANPLAIFSSTTIPLTHLAALAGFLKIGAQVFQITFAKVQGLYRGEWTTLNQVPLSELNQFKRGMEVKFDNRLNCVVALEFQPGRQPLILFTIGSADPEESNGEAVHTKLDTLLAALYTHPLIDYGIPSDCHPKLKQLLEFHLQPALA